LFEFAQIKTGAERLAVAGQDYGAHPFGFPPIFQTCGYLTTHLNRDCIPSLGAIQADRTDSALHIGLYGPELHSAPPSKNHLLKCETTSREKEFISATRI
jgi:hypothetical protein